MAEESKPARREVWLVIDPNDIPVRAVSSEAEAIEIAGIESDQFLSYGVDGPFVRLDDEERHAVDVVRKAREIAAHGE